MKIEKGRIYDAIRRKGAEDTLLAHLIQFFYSLFSNCFVQTVVSIVETVVIAIMLNNNYYGAWFVVCIVFYILASFAIVIASSHKHNKIRDVKTFQKSLNNLGTSFRSLSRQLNKVSMKLKKTDKSKIMDTISDIDFQSVAFIVCETLRDTLSRRDEKDDVFVSVFQKKVDKKKTCCSMIAHSEKNDISGFEDEYQIPLDAEYGKDPYYTYIFSKNIKEVTSFHTKELVQKAFAFHEKRIEREKSIHQYICIPIAPRGLGVTFLLQVDTNEPNFFGKTKKAVNDFGKNTIYPYAEFLHMIYEQMRLIEILADK